MGDGTITINPEHYTLRQETIQPQGAMVVTDITTGQIKVMVGGRSLKGRLLYNRADNPRQPGSSIKPIGVYGPALQSGVDLDTGWTAGSTIEDKPNYVNGKLWPKNSNNKYDGWITLRTCVEQSKNVPSVNLVNDIGYDYSIDFLKKNGVTTVVEDGDTNDKNPAALALGGMSKGISPIEMASAYATFPNQGVHVEPTTYTKVTDSQGNVLLESQPEETRVFDESVAFIMTDILRTTVTNGIAGRAAIGVAPVGGKTGTANKIDAGTGKYGKDYYSSFIGMAPMDDPQVSILVIADSPKGSYYGSMVAAPIAKEILTDTLRYLNVTPTYSESEKKAIEGNYTVVPKVVGKPFSEAVGIIGGKELKYSRPKSAQGDDEFTVVDQYPKAGTKVKKNSVVYVYKE